MILQGTILQTIFLDVRRTIALSLTATLFLVMCMPVAVLAAPEHGVDSDHSASVEAADVAVAIKRVPRLAADSDAPTSQQDADSIQTAAGGVTVDVPKNAKDGVVFASEKQSMTITLPNAASAEAAQQVAPGIVVYGSNKGFANAVQATEDNGVRLLTVIDAASAQTEYSYGLSVPEGGHIAITEDGGAVVFGVDEQIISTIDTPWATDASGKSVDTWYTTDGQALTQHVEHNVSGVAYPVVADPLIKRWFGWEFQLSRQQTVAVMAGNGVAAAASFYIPEPFISKAVGAALTLSMTYAEWAYNTGGCLKVSVLYTGQFIPGHYYGGECR